MVKPKQYQDLYILMNGITVGTLSHKPTGLLTFRYYPDWLLWENRRPISLSMPLTEQPYKGDIVEHYFDNLLPDNEAIRNRIQTRFNIPSKKCFDLLSVIGKDCIGALQLLNQPSINNIKDIQATPLNDSAIANLLKHYQTAPLGMEKESDFRISIAGAQEKTALLWHKRKWQLPKNTTPTSHIFKLPIGFISHQHIDLSDSCENEWLCSQIAKAFGLPVANCDIQQFEDVKVLIVERFDRKLSQDKTWLIRLPQEDMCQALGISSNLKYQADGGPGIIDIMNLLLGSENPAEDRDLFFRSQVLFWLLAAIDGHAKNFSISIMSEGKYRLTPLYDIISAYPLIATKQLQQQKIKMAMALKGKKYHYHWHNVQRRHFIETANAANFSPERAAVILDDMLNQVDNVIDKVNTQLPDKFPKRIAQSIFDGMQAMKKRLE